MPKVILNVAASTDNFIADVNGVDWLPGEDSDPNDTCGMRSFKNDIYVIVMGSTSYKFWRVGLARQIDLCFHVPKRFGFG